MSKIRKCIGSLLALVVGGAGCTGNAGEPLEQVRQAVAKQEAVLVDVRERSEWDAGHVQGAKFLPLSQLEAQPQTAAAGLPKDKPLYLYCRSGRRSQIAARILQQQGFDARSLPQGFGQLSRNGFPSAKP